VAVEVGGGLRTYDADGVPVIAGFAESEMCTGCAGQLLAPWPNRIRDGRYTFAEHAYQLSLTEAERHNAIHGLVNWTCWHPVEVGEDAVTLAVDLPPQPGYPWPLRLTTRWSVGESGLTSTTTATNVGEVPCPFGFAAHPYLAPPAGTAVDDLLLHVPAEQRLLVDGRLLPIGAARVAGTEFDFSSPRRIGALVLDTAFGGVTRDPDGASTVTVSTVDGAGVRIWADAGFGWWQVFTADTLTAERKRAAVAVEPMTCPPDAFRSRRDLITLEPGETWSGTWGVARL
jgi:aldose 1-epimerase